MGGGAQKHARRRVHQVHLHDVSQTQMTAQCEKSLTEVRSHLQLLLEGLLSADGNEGRMALEGVVALCLAMCRAPEKLLLQDVEEGDDVPETSERAIRDVLLLNGRVRLPLDFDIAKCYRQQQHLNLLGRGGKGQQQSEDVVDSGAVSCCFGVVKG